MFKCERSNCSKTFSFNTNRIRHQKICVNGELEKSLDNFTCNNEYGKTLTTKFNFDRHITTCMQTAAKEFPCPTCSKQFSKELKLKRHDNLIS